jgi:hypothetical protein
VPLTTDNPFLLQVIQTGDKRIPEALHIPKYEGLSVILQGTGSSNSKEFVKGADAARQYDKGVTLCHH